MRPRWPTAALVVAALSIVPACRAGEGAAPHVAPADRVDAPAQPFEPSARLCDAIPDHVVAAAIGRSPVTVDGAGTQCSWRAPAPSEASTDVVLQGSFIDTRSFDIGRPDGAPSPVPGLGDEAYVVRIDGDAPTTLYVRDGHRAFALWMADEVAEPDRAETALTELARQVLEA